MKKRSKKYKESLKLFDKSKAYNLDEAVSVLKKMPSLKFDQSIDQSRNALLTHLTVQLLSDNV